MPRCRHASDTFPSVSANSSTLMRCRASFSSAFIGFSPCAYYAPILSSEKPSSTFYADEQFDEYLKAFMALHDERQRNEWDAYYRLLTDYVGVNRDGTLRVGYSVPRCQDHERAKLSSVSGCR